ncbi:alpha/beta-hydrolase [Athelia psychrophila]|uniref:Alpha/beta-hydrolase n=1 Tax=Athelia psychrophila TaxID=1759441 RepID=A0A166PPY4_9AGAM|nr:alpha/beta-hydrolase [Fibularhizoctonia sp. CBS 109695]
MPVRLWATHHPLHGQRPSHNGQSGCKGLTGTGLVLRHPVLPLRQTVWFSNTPNDAPTAPPINKDTRQSMPSNGPPHPRKEPDREPHTEISQESLDTIHRLIQSPVLYDPLRAPRYPIVLCHGLYGFDERGPAAIPMLRVQYWSNVLQILRKKVGAEVIVTAVPGTGSIASRSENLDKLLREKAPGRGINLMAHSMGGLDCRHLISHVRPTEYTPLSLTTISTPHRGSPFMDWCAENIGLGRLQRQELEKSKLQLSASESPESTSAPPLASTTAFNMSLSSLPSSVTSLLLSALDSPAYSNLTSAYLNNVFNPSTPDDPNVKYFSVAGRTGPMSIWHPLWLPKVVLDGWEEKGKETLKKEWEAQHPGPQRSEGNNGNSGPRRAWERADQWGNDGLVTIQSAKWGEFLGTLQGCDHWEIRGARGIELNVDFPPLGIGSLAEVGDGWGFRDWGKFVGAWRTHEQKEGRAGDKGDLVAEEHGDAIAKSSTGKLSAVFDWLAEQVPAPVKMTAKDKDSAHVELVKKEEKKPEKGDLATQEDLERFYVSLARKLYDAGL